MSAVCRGFQQSPVLLEFVEEGKGQGIVPIDGLSSRRTFSADMSSKKWLAEYLPLKKIASSEQISTMSLPREEDSSSIAAAEVEQSQEESKEHVESRGEFDIWSAIQTEKTIGSNSSAPIPYVHPLVKRSASLLSQKSLEICTESLGSETGSDRFSSSDDLDYSPSHKHEEEEEGVHDVKKELGAENYNFSINHKSTVRSFPPPLPSLSHRNGPCLHMRPHRKDGRLVLEAIQFPSYNYFHAERHGGRLRLTLIKNFSEKEKYDDNHNAEEGEELDPIGRESHLGFEEEERCMEDVASDKGIVLEMNITHDIVASGVMTVHRSALVMNKIMRGKSFKNPNPWNEKSEEEERVECESTIQLPPMVPFNTYEGYWKSSSAPSDNPLLLKPQDFLLVKRCNEANLMIWKPVCIATS